MTIKIIMDTDPGIDDAAALTIGAEQPLFKDFEDAARIHGASGMPGYEFPTDLPRPLNKTAVEALHDEIMASSDPVTLVPTGSYTNIALLFSEYPEVKSHIDRIVAMGGALGKGNMTSAAEFNVFTDPDAAAIVYKSGVPIVMVGLDITMKALLTHESIEELPKISETGKMLHDIIVNDGDNSDAGIAMHDVNTILAIKTEDMWIDVVTDGPAIGETVGDIRGAYHNGKTNAKVSTDIDAVAFNKWFLEEVRAIKN
ncbi:nucleoside hydrolase [Levilactobacillus brevis]|nr:nucleoside hydrolase [Levilactobacillus brevis]